MNKCSLDLWWGTPESEAAYRADALTVEQGAQAAARGGPRAQRDWRVSRALMQAQAQAAARLSPSGARAVQGAIASDLQSLSHRLGHALFVHGGPVQKLGVDLETMRPRDVLALAAWICTEAEQDALARTPEFARQRIFYTLWTLKEAFLKAGGGDFPADMRRAGLVFPASYGAEPAATDGPSLDGCRLRPPDGGPWQGVTYGLGDNWIASVVWRAGAGTTSTGLQWRPGPYAVLPKIHTWGDWRL